MAEVVPIVYRTTTGKFYPTPFVPKCLLWRNATISHPLAEVSFKKIWRREANVIIRLGNPCYLWR